MSRSLRGSRVLVTAGPTREALDPVRFLTNASTGAMGFALARSARRLGARVTVVAGPCAATPPRGVSMVPVVTARQMRRQTLARCRKADVVIAAAAVGDWRFSKVHAAKLKKDGRPLRLTLLPNPDIIADVSRRLGRRRRAVLVGFALETSRLIANARAKLGRKGLDLVVANGPASLGRRTRFAVVGKDGSVRRYPSMPKARAARIILGHAQRCL